jgi:hypothetical protein
MVSILDCVIGPSLTMWLDLWEIRAISQSTKGISSRVTRFNVSPTSIGWLQLMYSRERDPNLLDEGSPEHCFEC